MKNSKINAKKKLTPSILWLSDIHYKQFLKSEKLRIGTTDIEEIPEDESFKLTEIKCINKYFEILIKQIKKENYTHILISGDLAFSGDVKQYVSLYHHFINEILKDENIRLITIPGNHDVDYSSMNDFVEKYFDNETFKEKRNFVRSIYNAKFETNVEYKLLSNYQTFFNSHLKNRLLKLEEKKSIKLFCYEQSNGLFGIIYDIEYNIIFNCLNSSWVCVGDKNIINKIKKDYKALDVNERELLNKLLDNVEHGNIIIGELSDVQGAFNDLEDSSKDECCIITCMHHPISWLHYDHIYNDDNFKWLIENTDVFLTGHLHVPHHPPMSYRNQTYFLEAPQLLDYHLYSEAELAEELKLGYSLITIDLVKNNFTIKNIGYSLDKSGNIHLPSKENTKDLISYPFKRIIAKRKSILFDFTTKEDIKKFFNEKKLKVSNIIEPEDDFYEKHSKLLSSLPEFTDTKSEADIIKERNYVAVKDKNKCFVILFINPEISENDNKNRERLLKDFSFYITSLLGKIDFDNESFNLKILFYDYWVFLFNKKNNGVKIQGEYNILENYQFNYEKLKEFFTILRYNVFNEDNVVDETESLDNLSLSFEILNLERYLPIFISD